MGMAAYSSGPTTTFDPWAVRVYITHGGTTTGQAPDVVVLYSRSYELYPHPAKEPFFSPRRLNALERRALRMQAAFEMRVVEERHRRLTRTKPPAPPRVRQRCCSLANAWRARP